MKVGDMVRHRIGSIDRIGIIVYLSIGDIDVHFFDGTRGLCRRSFLEVISENR